MIKSVYVIGSLRNTATPLGADQLRAKGFEAFWQITEQLKDHQ